MLHPFTPELEVKQKLMYTYKQIDTIKDGIKLVNIIRIAFYFQNDDKKYLMVAVDIDKQFYLFYKSPN